MGQPVPTYSTVSLAVSGHVDTRSRPPSGVAASSVNTYTSLEPAKKELNPASQLPDAYMAALPAASVERAGATPSSP